LLFVAFYHVKRALSHDLQFHHPAEEKRVMATGNTHKNVLEIVQQNYGGTWLWSIKSF